ncbi:hypothetical protein P8452_32961 [Trifolium repens]|nr:hypothetical protein P8452_32961 [Trifolium repens]
MGTKTEFPIGQPRTHQVQPRSSDDLTSLKGLKGLCAGFLAGALGSTISWKYHKRRVGVGAVIEGFIGKDLSTSKVTK